MFRLEIHASHNLDWGKWIYESLPPHATIKTLDGREIILPFDVETGTLVVPPELHGAISYRVSRNLPVKKKPQWISADQAASVFKSLLH